MWSVAAVTLSFALMNPFFLMSLSCIICFPWEGCNWKESLQMHSQWLGSDTLAKRFVLCIIEQSTIIKIRIRNMKLHKNSRYLNDEPSCEITLGDTNLWSCIFLGGREESIWRKWELSMHPAVHVVSAWTVLISWPF